MSLNQILLQTSPLPSNLTTPLPYKDVVFQSVLTDTLIVTGGTNFKDPGLKTIGLVGSGADTEVSATQDVAPAIEAFLAQGIQQIFIYEGTYAVKTPISYNSVSNVNVFGAGRDITILRTDAGVSGFDCRSAANSFNCQLSNLTIIHSTSTTGNTGTYGMQMGYCKTWLLTNVKIFNFDVGLELSDVCFYNNFFAIDIGNSSSIGIHITFGVNDRCNANCFYGCKVLNNNAAGVYITRGNENHFYGCHIENWKTYGFVAAGNLADANGMFGGRLESNNQSSTGYILFDTSAKNNFMYNPYVSGNDIASNVNPVTDNGTGSYYEFASFQGEISVKNRGLITAGDFITFNRNGSGNNSSLMTLNDSYTPSGTPTTLTIKTERASGNFIVGSRGGNNYLTISAQGTMDLGRNMGLGTLQQADQNIELDMIASSGGSQWDSRLIRGSGTNGNLVLANKGAGQTQFLVNQTNQCICLTSSGNVGIGQFTSASPGALVHFRERDAALVILNERSNAGAFAVNDPLVNEFYRASGTNVGQWAAAYDITPIWSNPTQNLSYFTPADASGGTLTRRFRIYADGTTEHLRGLQTPATEKGYQFTGSYTLSINYGVNPFGTLNTSFGYITVTNLEDIPAGSTATQPIVIDSTLIGVNSIVTAQVIDSTACASGSCVIVKQSYNISGGAVRIGLFNAGTASSGASKTIYLCFEVKT